MPEYLPLKYRRKIENFLEEDSVTLGVVEIDPDLCQGCGICAKACAASSLEIKDKKCRMVEVMPFCIGCGDCVAICPEKAITLTRFLKYHLFFRYLDRGEPSAPRNF